MKVLHLRMLIRSLYTVKQLVAMMIVGHSIQAQSPNLVNESSLRNRTLPGFSRDWHACHHGIECPRRFRLQGGIYATSWPFASHSDSGSARKGSVILLESNGGSRRWGWGFRLCQTALGYYQLWSSEWRAIVCFLRMATTNTLRSSSLF